MYGVVWRAVILGISARHANACLVSNYFCCALFERLVFICASSVHTFGGVCTNTLYLCNSMHMRELDLNHL